MEKINYVIATWSGKRRAPNKNYLKNHILKLSTLKHNLSQITIVKPIFSGLDEEYYNIQGLIDQIDCNVVILERGSNIGESYGQLFYAYQIYKDKFDYYIFCEDDYLPHIDNFDSELLKRQNKTGYLCSFCGVNEKYPNGGCSISNGLISFNQFEKIHKKFKDPILKINGSNGNECHKNFADLLIECGLTFTDFASDFSVPYFGHNIIEYGNPDSDKILFAPHQLLDYKMSFSEMKIEDLYFFLNVRNQSTEFLHNDNKFSMDQAKKWFAETNPKYFMINLEKKSIGYFRTSNWDESNKSMYLGCDIHPNYRGFGFSQEAYVKFIDFLNTNFGIKKINLEVLSTNERAIYIYKKIGFVNIGYGEKVFKNGEYIESILMEYII